VAVGRVGAVGALDAPDAGLDGIDVVELVNDRVELGDPTVFSCELATSRGRSDYPALLRRVSTANRAFPDAAVHASEAIIGTHRMELH
jgi:hypothetical protein